MKKEMNKGFSLVELIIVIAIMAVLVGLLAPQYLRFVNNSKVSTDISNGQELATAFNVAFADGKISGTSYSGAGGSTLSVAGISATTWPAAKYKASNTQWTISIGADGVSKVELGGTEVWPNPSAYETFNK